MVAKFEFPETPPWLYIPVNVNLSLTETKKEDTNPDYFLSKYREIKEIHEGYEFIYTDGSHINNKSAAAAVKDDHVYSERLPDYSTIFTAEMYAIFMALDHVETSENSRFLIFSDSKSVLQSLQSKDWKNPLVQKVLERHHWLRNQHKQIKFCWIPSHIGIDGNEAADIAAKEALGKRKTDLAIPHTDYKTQIKSYVRVKWQQRWDQCVYNRLHCIQPNLGNWKF